jgi:hypothetical protein
MGFYGCYAAWVRYQMKIMTINTTLSDNLIQQGWLSEKVPPLSIQWTLDFWWWWRSKTLMMRCQFQSKRGRFPFLGLFHKAVKASARKQK